MTRPYYNKHDSAWYKRMKEVGQHLQTSFRIPNRKVRYITLCKCGDIHSSTTKEGARYHTSSHQYGRSSDSEPHDMQTFREFDIW